ncbi:MULTISPECIES: pilus assembly protein TadG-related protein [unclassified Bradyrhizobium]|uniref:pilus assembly protein TadG-related protein n=1 Tax=unclassified Bradyrhizobium TaxID=2631580 RepID=UPI00247AA5E8|nr:MULTISPECIES: pilus assembly protein TadG-related protein [unclassified Bradyrhizobium]WGS23850.1 pilus assembly protein TadG-related protein [Bradyrhizobium sp. ISRA463]WGS31161.1 pilus assembly protein TadG-related protein [Bradyrhizobium sp. ISRA464]
MLRCCRGSAAFATVVALVPLIGFVALGAEAGSWYVVKQHAQNAADSAAMAGALAIANSDSQPNFGTMNGFSSNVTLTQGTYSTSSGFSSGGTSPNAVQAVVTQCQPQSLSLVVYTGTCNGTSKNVTITAQAVASVGQPKKLPCALALSGPVTFQDAAVQVNAPNCGIASNGTPIGINFSVAPKTLNVGSLSTAGGCSGSLCGSVVTYAPPVTDPFSALTTAVDNLTLPACGGATLQSYGTGQCANDKQTINSATQITVSGIYFFSGGLSLGGTGSLTTASGVTATIIILPVSGNKASLKMAGGSSFNITAPTTAPSASAIPSQLSSVASLLTDMALFDPEKSPQITGNGTMMGSGVFYLPNAALNYQGTSTSASSTCTEVIAASIQFSGTPSFDNSGCPPSIVPTSKLVVLVQ